MPHRNLKKSGHFAVAHQLRRSANQSQQDAEIAATCARIIAEEGEQDYARATRKALARLNLPENTRYPRHADITEALTHYLALFQADSQPDALRRLRIEARNILKLLDNALPNSAAVLVGAVALGHANAFSAIEIELLVDDYKTFDFFLFDHEIDTRIEADGNFHGDPHESRSKNKGVIYHVLHTACDVKFKPILLNDSMPKNASRHIVKTSSKQAISLQELEALLMSVASENYAEQ
jgi:hypothetical protein